MKIKQRVSVAVTPFLVLSLIFSALPANAQPEEGISKTEILLGATFPQTGVLSPHYQDFFAGANAYFDYLNSKGGIYGRKVRLILRDDSGNTGRAGFESAALVMTDRVFALFNSSPLTASHLATVKVAAISQRKIPNLAVTAPYSGFSDAAKYPTTFQLNGNQKQEFKSLLYFYENVLGSPPLTLLLPDDDNGVDFKDLRITLGQITTINGVSGPYPRIPYDVADSREPPTLRDTGVMSLWPRHNVSVQSRKLVTSERYPLLVRGSSISSSLSNFFVASTKSRNLYANFNMPLYTDTSDPFISFFTSVFKEFTPTKDFTLEINVNDSNKSVFNYVSQQMYEGANAAYVVAQAIAAIGPEPTRASLISFLRNKSKTLSTASFSPVDYATNNAGESVQFIAKYDGVKWVKNSDFYLVNPSGTSIKSVTPPRIPLLANGVPLMKSTELSTKAISCISGKKIKEVSGKNPTCPKGFKQK